MNKGTFNLIIKALDQRITDCSNMLPSSTSELEDFTLKRVQTLKRFVHTELEIMDRIIMIDLYHIIGMGELSPQQMMKFTYKVKEYLSYRSTLKAIEGNEFSDLDDLPKIPVGARFKLLEFPVTLQIGREDVIEEETVSSIEESTEKTLDYFSEAPFSLDTKKSIFVKIDRLEDFRKDLGGAGSLATLASKVRNHGTYLGISWLGTVDDKAIGKVISPKDYLRLKRILKEKYGIV